MPHHRKRKLHFLEHDQAKKKKRGGVNHWDFKASVDTQSIIDNPVGHRHAYVLGKKTLNGSLLVCTGGECVLLLKRRR